MSQLHPCPDCDFIGPDLSPLTAQLRELHRAFADIGWAFAHATGVVGLVGAFHSAVVL